MYCTMSQCACFQTNFAGYKPQQRVGAAACRLQWCASAYTIHVLCNNGVGLLCRGNLLIRALMSVAVLHMRHLNFRTTLLVFFHKGDDVISRMENMLRVQMQCKIADIESRDCIETVITWLRWATPAVSIFRHHYFKHLVTEAAMTSLTSCLAKSHPHNSTSYNSSAYFASVLLLLPRSSTARYVPYMYI